MSRSYELRDVLVEVKGVSLKYGDRQILRPIDAEVRDIVRPGLCQGQVVGILGPSGVGKTQFSRILAGLQDPTTGTVTAGGKKVTAGLVGMVAQSYPLFPHRTVRGNLLLALEKSGLSRKDRDSRVTEYLTRFGLADRDSLYPSQLSGGQRQRVAIVRELLCSEFFIVMDEPFTGLDPVMKDRACDLIIQVSNMDERNTIFVVAHDIASLVAISDTLWLFGRDRDERDEPMPGAYVKRAYNLVHEGLAWTPGISSNPRFAEFCAAVRKDFDHL